MWYNAITFYPMSEKDNVIVCCDYQDYDLEKSDKKISFAMLAFILGMVGKQLKYLVSRSFPSYLFSVSSSVCRV